MRDLPAIPPPGAVLRGASSSRAPPPSCRRPRARSCKLPRRRGPLHWQHWPVPSALRWCPRAPSAPCNGPAWWCGATRGGPALPAARRPAHPARQRSEGSRGWGQGSGLYVFEGRDDARLLGYVRANRQRQDGVFGGGRQVASDVYSQTFQNRIEVFAVPLYLNRPDTTLLYLFACMVTSTHGVAM